MLSKYFGPEETAQTDAVENEPLLAPVSAPAIPPSPNVPPLAQTGTPLSESKSVENDGVFCSVTPFDIALAQEFVQVLHYNPRRKYLLVQNTTIASLDNDGTIQVILDDAPAIGTPSIKRSITLTAGGAWEPLKCPTNPITIRTTSPQAQGVVVEGQ